MKKIRFPAIITAFIFSFILISCSKENLNATNSDKMANNGQNDVIFNYGAITGTLTPAPYYGAIKAYSAENNVAVSTFADANGRFRLTELLPGTYRVVVVYSLKAPEGGEYQYHEISGVVVQPGITTDLGDIILTPK